MQKLIVIAIGLLVCREAWNWISEFVSNAWALVMGTIASIVIWYCNYRANKTVNKNMQFWAWKSIPLLIVIVPTAGSIYNFFQEDKSWIVKLLEASPLWLGFVFPVGLLLYAHWKIGSPSLRT